MHDKISEFDKRCYNFWQVLQEAENCYYILRSMRYYKKLQLLLQFITGISKCKDLLLCFAIGANIAKRKRLQLRFTEGFRALISNHVIIFP